LRTQKTLKFFFFDTLPVVLFAALERPWGFFFFSLHTPQKTVLFISFSLQGISRVVSFIAACHPFRDELQHICVKGIQWRALGIIDAKRQSE
jgi:hypothetical protein